LSALESSLDKRSHVGQEGVDLAAGLEAVAGRRHFDRRAAAARQLLEQADHEPVVVDDQHAQRPSRPSPVIRIRLNKAR